MAIKGSAARKTQEQELVVTRVVAAPRDRVFKAWTEPEHMERWWGPNGFTTPFCKIDLRPGGTIHYCMRSPEGRDYWGKGVYREIVRPERIVVTDSFSDETGATVDPSKYEMDPEWPREALISVTFAERGGGTEVTVHHGVPESVAERVGCRQGWSESLDRLAAYLEKG